MVSADLQRQCPVCGSTETTLVRRGFIGPTDERDQYLRCQQCGRVTYEILSRSPREVRAQGLAPGQTVTIAGQRYVIRQLLRAGPNEYLVYVRLQMP
ncbi:hypothetical protein HRbin26_01049 [bacterium HR26]|nr:hypothetical protein HRbin26_01049 [bacterium HR26]